MALMIRGCVQMIVPLLGCAILLGFAASVHADPKPLTKEEQAKVDQAIDKAVAFLKRSQKKDGEWSGKMYTKLYPVGQCALPAYALLESGVPADDPVIQKAAEYVRPRVLASDETYELSLAILFLDRLADAKDKKLIQTLASRLLAGQHQTGGWSYRCPILSEKGEQDLLYALGEVRKAMRDQNKTRDQVLQGMVIPPSLQPLPVFRPAIALQWSEPDGGPDHRVSLTGQTDNSNTQFAMLGLWVAQRHNIPVEPSLEIMVERFERTQTYPEGLWRYGPNYVEGSRSMICVGLMGLAIGRGLKMQTPGSYATNKKDIHVLRGLAALRRGIQNTSGSIDKPVALIDLYFLWSLERVAMLYNLPTIGDKDWYRWGAQSLLGNQSKLGSWTGSSSHPSYRGQNYKPTLSTAFALLFLKRSHPMRELTQKLPFKAKDLNEGLARLRPSDKFTVRSLTTPAGSKNPEQTTTTPSHSRNSDP